MIKMTRGHYILIAELFAGWIADTREDDTLFDSADRTLIEKLARHTADRLASTNGRFDRDRFLSACGI